jgi:hypothetical protein
MFVQTLPRRSLPLRMPDTESGTLEGRLRMRRYLQLRPCLYLQAFVNNSNRAAYCALELGPTGRTWADTRRRLEAIKDASMPLSNGAIDNTFV